jgi:aminopeptidase-like protein
VAVQEEQTSMEHVNPGGLGLSPPGIGSGIHALAARLFPICRSITGDGVRRTLGILAEHIAIEQHEVPSGTQVFDWTIPREWSIRSASIRDMSGRTVVDFADSNLHVLNYSVPYAGMLPLEELKKHIHTLPEQPDLVPYRTSYYSDAWGFCMSHNRLAELPDGDYRVEIDSELRDGSLSYGEFYIPGEMEHEFLFSAHVCHPSLANDNCSGLAVLTFLAKELSSRNNRYSYRFLFAPGTIGALAWLAGNEGRLGLIDHGLTVSCVGDGGGPVYKRSRRGNAFIDRAMAQVLRGRPNAAVLDFSPYGYDERQFCSPGFNLPVGCFQRSQWGTFPEYHTSADNMDFIRPEHLETSLAMLLEAVEIAEGDWTPVNRFPMGEPQLGRRGLYSAIGGNKSAGLSTMAMLWVLNLADGECSLLSMAERSGLSFQELAGTAALLREHGMLADPSGRPPQRT